MRGKNNQHIFFVGLCFFFLNDFPFFLFGEVGVAERMSLIMFGVQETIKQQPI